MIPELLKANGKPCDQTGVPIHLLTERSFMAHSHSWCMDTPNNWRRCL